MDRCLTRTPSQRAESCVKLLRLCRTQHGRLVLGNTSQLLALHWEGGGGILNSEMTNKTHKAMTPGHHTDHKKDTRS